jgi:hypothetical protein
MKSKLGKNKFTAHIANRIYRLFQHDIDSSKIRIGQQTLLASKALRSNFNRLADAEVTVFSQWGEDGILDYLCDIAGFDRPNTWSWKF